MLNTIHTEAYSDALDETSNSIFKHVFLTYHLISHKEYFMYKKTTVSMPHLC
jgi:hypothetical protein